MKSVSGSIKKFPITLTKGCLVFVEGDSVLDVAPYAGKPLRYTGTHTQTGQLMFVDVIAQSSRTIYMEHPIIGCILPESYLEGMWALFDMNQQSMLDEMERDIALQALEHPDGEPEAEPESATVHSLGAKRAAKDPDSTYNNGVAHLLRTTADEIEAEGSDYVPSSVMVITTIDDKEQGIWGDTRYRIAGYNRFEANYAIDEIKALLTGVIPNSLE